MHQPNYPAKHPLFTTLALTTVLLAAGCGSTADTAPARPPAPKLERLSPQDLRLMNVTRLEGEKNTAAAVAELKTLVAEGHAPSIFHLAENHREGAIVPRNHVEATALYRVAAEKGHGESMRRLTLMLEKGEGVPHNVAEAYTWASKAAAAGNAAGMNDQGLMLEFGRGVASDPKAAAALYRKAADLGNHFAMFNLGLAYEKGVVGGKADPLQAANWFIAAAYEGNPSAKSKVTEAGYRSPPQVMAALNQVVSKGQRWRAANYKDRGPNGGDVTLFNETNLQSKREVANLLDIEVYPLKTRQTVFSVNVRKSTLNAGYTAREVRTLVMKELGLASANPNYLVFEGDAK